MYFHARAYSPCAVYRVPPQSGSMIPKRRNRPYRSTGGRPNTAMATANPTLIIARKLISRCWSRGCQLTQPSRLVV